MGSPDRAPGADNDGNYMQGFGEQVGVWRSEVSTGAF